MPESTPTKKELLDQVDCNLCARRDGCMPYSDEDLISGAQGGHVPSSGECGLFIQGDAQSKELALDNLVSFNQYAADLVKGSAPAPMSEYTRIAKQKITELIQRDDFGAINSISAEFIHIAFINNRPCRVNPFGKVEWLKPDGVTPL